MPANLNILATYSGGEALRQLEKQLVSINAATYQQNQMAKIASMQNKIEIALIGKRNALLQGQLALDDSEIQLLGDRISLNQELTFQTENRLRIATEAAILQRAYADEFIFITEQEARAATIANQQIIEGEMLKRQAINETRKTLMAASISMFVLNISMGQLVQSIKPLVKGNEDLEKSVNDITAALQFSMAPLQAYMALQMISKSLADEQKVSFLGVASALGGVFFLYEAITSKSPALRAAYAGIATALFAVAIASWMANVALATGKTLIGDWKAFGIVAAGVAASAAIVAGLTAPKAQTLTGHSKRVRKGGIALLDDDEVVSRQSKDATMSEGGGITIYLPDSYTGTLSDARITAETVRRYTQTGQGPVKFRRKVT